MADIRAQVLSLMRKAISKGQSRTSFLNEMKAQNLTYQNKQMLSDWAQLTDFNLKDGKLKNVRKDAYPSDKTVVTTDWAIQGEYMYKVKVTSRVKPDEPVTERFVNIVTDKPMTPRMIEQAVVEKWSEYEDYSAESLEDIIPWTAIRTTL